MKRSILLLLPVLSAMLMFSCEASHRIELMDERHTPGTGFDYEVLTQKGLAVCGFTNGPVTLSSMEQMQYGMLLSNKILTEMKHADKMNFLTPAQLMDILGKETYTARLSNFRMTATLDSLTLAALQDSLITPAYALFAELETESIIRDRDEHYQENEKGEEELIVEYYTLYRMTIWFRLYDLRTGSSVFSIRVKDTARRSEDQNLGAGCVTQMINSMLKSMLSSGEPAEITREEVLGSIFKGFAENFPLRTAPYRL